eukprot:673675-Pyramimonas_sp.AAC.1
MLKGRQIYWHILQPYSVTGFDDDLQDFERLKELRMRGEDLPRFTTDWDALLLDCKEAPNPTILESLFRTQIRRHAWMKQDMYEYQRMKISDPN